MIALNPDTVGCRTPLCDRPPVVYLGGPTGGVSPRLLVVGGPRAALLAEPAALGGSSAACAECAHAAVDELLARVGLPTEPAREEGS